MLGWIPVFGPCFASFVEERAGERIIKQVLGNVVTVALFSLILLIVGVLGRTYDVAGPTSWIVDFIVITYVIQSVCGIIGAIRTLAEFGDGWSWNDVMIKLSGATLAGAIQAAALPLLGLLLVWIQLGAGRAYLSYTYGGGFFGWLEASVGAWNPMRWLAGLFA
jgi:hypothetical protein